MMMEQKNITDNITSNNVLEESAQDTDDVVKNTVDQEQVSFSKRENFFDSKAEEVKSVLLRLQRVSHGASGGRVFSYNALVIVGDEKNNIGFASAKAKLASDAIRKAKRLAQKRSLTFSFGDKCSIPFEAEGRYHSTTVYLRPSREGSGLRASFIIRSMLSLLGVRNVSSKIIGGRHRVSVAMATIDALQNVEKNIDIFHYRNKSR